MSVRLAVLGAGRIGQVHADAIAQVRDATLVSISDPIAEAAQLVADRHGCDIRDFDEVAGSDDVDAVIICTPTDIHADQVELFARAGKAVFCEKPVDLSMERVHACLRVVEDTGTTLMVGFQRRFDPDINALKAEIDAGRIGKVEMVTLTSRDPGPPPYEYIKRSGGIFKDMMIHDLDVARWLLGEEVEHVQAAASVLTDPGIGEIGDYDSANVILTTATGKQCTITNSRRATYGYDQRIEVHGSDGAVSMGNQHLSQVTLANGDGYTAPPLLNFFITRYAAAYAAEIAAFVKSLRDGTQPLTTGHDGLMSLALAEACLLSVREGRRVAVAEILG